MIHLAGDIAKAEIVTFDGERWLTIPNTQTGISKRLKALPPGSVVVLEATANYGDLFARMAYEAGHTVYVVQPSWIKAYRRSRGNRAKTDKIDAKKIHEYILQNKEDLHPWRPLEPALQELKELVRQRQKIADDLCMTRQRYKGLQMDPKLIQMLQSGMKQVKKDLDKKIKSALRKLPVAKVLLSVPGIGIQIAATVIVVLEHIPFATSDAFIAFAGLDPVSNDSGTSEGKRSVSKKGDVFLRRALYLASMSGSRTKAWKDRYASLKARGLKPKQALVALAKKIATVAFYLHRNQIEFDASQVVLKARTV
jgi:transposase